MSLVRLYSPGFLEGMFSETRRHEKEPGMLVPGPYKHPPQQLFSSKLETTHGQVATRVNPPLCLSRVL